MGEFELHKGKFFIERLKPLVFQAWAHIWNANPELDMPEFGVKSKNRVSVMLSEL